MKYMFLLYAPDRPLPEPGTPEGDEMLQTYGAAVQAMAHAGVLIDSAPLGQASRATTIRIREGATFVTDGPAAELKEQVGGYTLVECSDLDEALKWAATIPTARVGAVEVRPVLGRGERADRQG
ncbi:MAG: YciI family protein [Actinomycetota bacterium]|nr:YciI family protein [Actinomycetota bacterium]